MRKIKDLSADVITAGGSHIMLAIRAVCLVGKAVVRRSLCTECANKIQSRRKNFLSPYL